MRFDIKFVCSRAYETLCSSATIQQVGIEVDGRKGVHLPQSASQCRVVTNERSCQVIQRLQQQGSFSVSVGGKEAGGYGLGHFTFRWMSAVSATELSPETCVSRHRGCRSPQGCRAAEVRRHQPPAEGEEEGEMRASMT